MEFVRRGIAAKQELHKICENMMDNCLASNSETGGVGCDNMTMIVIALLRGRTKEEWYKEIGDRVANGDGPCAAPEYGKLSPKSSVRRILAHLDLAEFRGPGNRRRYEDSEDDLDLDMDQRTRFHSGPGRIILLGDGTEVLTDSDEQETFDHDDEDKDLDAQVSHGSSTNDDNADARNEREGTPAPEPTKETSNGAEPTTSFASGAPKKATGGVEQATVTMPASDGHHIETSESS